MEWDRENEIGKHGGRRHPGFRLGAQEGSFKRRHGLSHAYKSDAICYDEGRGLSCHDPVSHQREEPLSLDDRRHGNCGPKFVDLKDSLPQQEGRIHKKS